MCAVYIFVLFLGGGVKLNIGDCLPAGDCGLFISVPAVGLCGRQHNCGKEGPIRFSSESLASQFGNRSSRFHKKKLCLRC
jgi:hypothetical protein